MFELSQAAAGASAIMTFIGLAAVGFGIFLIVKFLLLCRDVGDAVALLQALNSSKKSSYLSPENKDKQTCKYCGEKYDVGQANCPYCGKK
jgi:hypothetical protein